MSQAIPAPTQHFRGKLARTMLGILIPISLVPLLVMGGMAYARSRQILNNQIESMLLSVEQQTQQKLALWIEAREERINEFYFDPAFDEAIQVVLASSGRGERAFSEARQQILDDLERINSTEKLIHQFFVLSPGGEILVASNPSLEGQWLNETAYFEALSREHEFLAIFSPDPIYNSLATITARPYFDDQGEHTATVWGMTGLSLFETILNDISFLGLRMYVITNDGTYVGVGPNIKEQIEGPSFEPAAEQAQYFSRVFSQTSTEIGELRSFDNQEVMAAFMPIPELDAGLVIEIPLTTIIQQLQNLPYFGVLLAITVMISIFLTWFGTQRIVRPILEVATSAQYFSEGDWQRRANVDRADEIGFLAQSFNQMADEISTLYRSLQFQVDDRTQQIRTAAEVAQIASSATNLDTLLQQTVQLIVERFGFYYAAIFLLDEYKEHALLRESYSATHQDFIRKEMSLPVGDGSIVGMVSTSNHPYIAPDVSQDPYYLPTEELSATRSEAVVPVSIGDNILGVLDVQSHRLNAFDADSVATLSTLSSQIASTIQNINLLESARVDLRATSALYQASHKIAESETAKDVLDALAAALNESPFISALFEVDADRLRGLAMTAPTRGVSSGTIPDIPLGRQALRAYFLDDTPLVVYSDEADTKAIPAPLVMMPKQMGCQAFEIFPILPDGELRAILILGAIDADRFTRVATEPYNSLIDITRTALEKVNALSTIQQRLVELETISTVGQSISTETNLDALYEIIHRQIIQVMGDVNFLIALYTPENDTIEVPYLDEGDEITSLSPFPLGKGLTSIVIRTCQPLMIIEDTIARSRALGAIVTEGREAKSWLGVPLLIGGEPIGAIVVQDLENEFRFDDDDLRLLVTLASQVAIAIRNARLLESTQHRAQQDRLLFEITSKIRRSPDMQTILKTTAQEINQALGASRTHIQITIGPDAQPTDQRLEEGEGEISA